ncbi:hypothetical protein C6497_07380 [Candidatus Poribacteria bacterium]|nr:MAG: hypothetical protein C6497_07380 [Candidatus Poribacteria bacterium]
MLTKDLLQYKIQKGQIYPQFVDPTNAKLLKVAEQLITVFENAVDNTKSTLLQESKDVIDGTSESPIILRGFEKLLVDRTEFDTAPNEELIAYRNKLFTETSRILSQEQFQDYAEYQQRVLGLIANDAELSDIGLPDQLYADLPSCQPVLSFRSISPEHLLHRYNTAQVQGLLLHCNSLTLRLTDSMTGELRQLFKYLRFHQLLSTIRKEKIDSGDIFQITVDGPLNLFYKTKRYGMNLANFFVAVLHQQKWELTAEIQFRNKRASQLSLDDSCGIKPISQQFLAYIPEDIQHFQQMLQNKTDEWQIQPGSQFYPLPGDTYCFPDYQLIHSSGAEVAIELFHPWHQGHLLIRLNTLSSKTDIPLIIGVSKELEKNATIAEALATSTYFSHYGFIFRDIPTMGTLLPILNSIVDKE